MVKFPQFLKPVPFLYIFANQVYGNIPSKSAILFCNGVP